MNKRSLRILILGTTWLLAGCSDYEMVRDDSSAPSGLEVRGSPVRGADSQPAGNRAVVSQGRTIRSVDGLCAVTVPPGWRTTTLLNPKAKLQVRYAAEDLNLIVMTDPKADIDFTDLHDIYERTHPEALAYMTDVRETHPVSLEINGLPALRYEVTGGKHMGGRHADNVFFLHTLVEGKEHVYRVIAFTLVPRLAKNRGAVESVANSFREINN